MSSTVVEVGPVTVRGPGPDSDLAGIAVAGIDDEITLVDDQPVAVADLWVEVLDAAAPGARRLTLVCPTWWTVEQCDRVRDAAIAIGAEVVVMQRVQAIGSTLTSESWVVVEISDEVVVVSGAGAPGVTLARHAEDDLDPEAVVRAVIAIAGASAEVAVDAPAEVVGATALGSAVMDGLRRRGTKVNLADARTWRVALTCPDTPAVAEPVGRRVLAGRLAIGAATTLAIVLGGIAFAAQGGAGDDGAMTVLVEGRVAMQIPAGWTVQRITDGPGSARVEVISPSDPQAAIHLTQSGIADGAVADTLQRALEEEPEGVFVDFDPAAVIAARRVVSYLEVRPGREVRWAVFVDRSVRIAIGCQSAPDRAAAVRAACEAATRSAHATG
ncbi:type VII secretion-associated protein [Mycobacterium sp. URHD0025]|uniref:type VII secretion-associated protein n=1 Tax=Mycobacterium sp. URHD0025 TaxID=1298864 RepID=UPI00048FFCFE|nr:type VII secretion-associated protein [Mycobacterium sp. URHD0025]